MKKALPVLIVVLVMIGFGVSWQLTKKGVLRETPTVANFEECVAAGNPVMESYPRQCRHGGQTFTEVIVQTFTQEKGPVSYSIEVPAGWFVHEAEQGVLFTQQETLDIPPGTEGYAIGPSFVIAVHNITDTSGVTNYDEWLEKYGMVGGENVAVGRLALRRFVMDAAGVGGSVLQYVYFADAQRAVTFSQFPYDPDSSVTQAFETAMRTFRVPERQGGAGILPFDSAVAIFLMGLWLFWIGVR